MPKRSTSESIVSQHSLIARSEAFLRDSPWVLRLTARKGKPAPVMIVKERLPAANPADGSEKASSARLKDMGLIYGQSLHRCMRPLQEMLARVCDADAVPLELHQLLTSDPQPIEAISRWMKRPVARSLCSSYNIICRTSIVSSSSPGASSALHARKRSTGCQSHAIRRCAQSLGSIWHACHARRATGRWRDSQNASGVQRTVIGVVT